MVKFLKHACGAAAHTNGGPHDCGYCIARLPLTEIWCYEEGAYIKSNDVGLLGVGTCHFDGILHHF